MAYTLEEKAVAAYRVKHVRTALKKRGIKYYTPAVMAIDPSVKPKQVSNVIHGGSHNLHVLNLLEQVAGIQPRSAKEFLTAPALRPVV